MMTATEPFVDTLSALSSQRPSPGGGVALVMTAALGCSLVLKAINISLKRGDNKTLSTAYNDLGDIQLGILNSADRDRNAYAAYRDNPESSETRLGCVSVPVAFLEDCAVFLTIAQTIKPYLSKYMRTDFVQGMTLIVTAMEMTSLNVTDNLKHLGKYTAASLSVRRDRTLLTASEVKYSLANFD